MRVLTWRRGDNALHYAIAAQVKRIHAIDMNPAQGHLLELKLAAISTLPYEDFWKVRPSPRAVPSPLMPSLDVWRGRAP